MNRVLKVVAGSLLGMATIVAVMSPASAQMPGSPVVEFEGAVGSSVAGSAVLAPLGEGTAVDLGLRGLEAGVEYTATLHGGSCEQPSASLTEIASFTGGADGTATPGGEVLFRGTEPVALAAVADGEHVILVSGPSGVVACAVVTAPAMPAVPAPAESGNAGLAGSGGTHPASLAVLGALGVAAMVFGARQVTALRD